MTLETCLKKSCMDSLFDSYISAYKEQPYLFAVLSSIVAAVGLSTNSATAIVGSMLLSPIGDLIVRGVLYDYLSVRTTVYSSTSWFFDLFIVMCIAIIIGFLWGIIYVFMDDPTTGEKFAKEGKWPTQEMEDRSKMSNAILMIPIALVGGIALPLAIRRSNSTKLVGIAIATALLPPLVNIGISLAVPLNTEETGVSKEDANEYMKNALITGAIIFGINILLLWLPSKLWFKYICVRDVGKGEHRISKGDCFKDHNNKIVKPLNKNHTMMQKVLSMTYPEYHTKSFYKKQAKKRN